MPTLGKVSSFGSDWRSVFHDIVNVLRILAPSAVLVAMGALAVVGSSQSAEAIRVLAEDISGGHPGGLTAFVVAMTFAGLSAWYWARVLIYLLHVQQPESARAVELAARHLPRACGVVPPLACAVGAYKASQFSTRDSLGVDHLLLVIAAGAVLLAIAMYLFFAFRHLLFRSESPQSTLTKQTTLRTLPRESKLVLAGTSLLWVVILIAVASTHGRAVSMLGPVSILLVSIGTWIPAVSALFYAGRVVRLPLVTLVGVSALLFSLFNL